ncbi:MAG TPA: hypothetical protein VGA21_06275 [Cyclobacteriaceae bacterium]|jgi:uncharacterized membrane protein
MKEAMLVIHFIGLTMALGAGFSNMFLGAAAAKLEPEERGKFMSKTFVLVRMGQTGLGLLLISGFYLITPYWKVLGEMPFLTAKLVLVGILIIMVSIVSVMARRALKENDPARLMKVRPYGMLNFFIGIAIVIMAVLAFN